MPKFIIKQIFRTLYCGLCNSVVRCFLNCKCAICTEKEMKLSMAIYIHTTVQKKYTRLDQNTVKSKILLLFKIAVFYLITLIFFIYSCDAQLNFQHHYSSLTWFFRNRYNTLICCSRNILIKQRFSRLIKLELKLWYIVFQDSLMNRK